MRFNKLGRSGLFVSELCLGTMTFGGAEGMWNTIGGLDAAASERIIGRALDAGITTLDTADVYSNGVSEEITGQALRNLRIPRDQVVVATKCYGQTTPGHNGSGNARVHVIAAVKASLKRLQMDHVDLYQLHGFDPATPMEETMHALDTLVQHGHVRYVGVSNWAAWQVVKANGLAERFGTAPISSVQSYYSLAGRDLEREIVPMLRSEGVGLLVWSPLAGGLLSGKYESGTGGRRDTLDFPPVDRGRADSCIAAMRPIAEARGVSVAQVAIGWLLHRKAVSSVIIGAKRIEQLDDNLAATGLDLSPDELDTLDAASALPPEYPGWMFERQDVRATRLHEAGRPGAR